MSKVYVVQDPDGKEILPAKEFGELHVILTGKETSSLALEKLKNAMRSMRPDDYLLLIGSPTNIGLATYVAMSRTGGKARILVWQRQTYTYKPEYINEYHDGTSTEPVDPATPDRRGTEVDRGSRAKAA